jgi:hypothetical protein
VEEKAEAPRETAGWKKEDATAHSQSSPTRGNVSAEFTSNSGAMPRADNVDSARPGEPW